MLLKAPHCGASTLQRQEPPPHSCAATSICRKTAGLAATPSYWDNTTLEVEGEENITIYRARIRTEDPEPHKPGPTPLLPPLWLVPVGLRSQLPEANAPFRLGN